MATNDWESLTSSEQRALLRKIKAQLLSKQFQRPEAFFKRALSFLDSAPAQTIEPKAKQHDPPKDLVVSARRDLSFFEANFELIDNSIDAWRKGGAKKDLHIEITYDHELLTGKYLDDAGGMDEADVYKVFIPGETTNRNFADTVIGSFGMGAKKGIFRLTDGAKIISCKSKEFSATSEVPEKWELTPQWLTMDGRAKPIGVGTTVIYLYRLFNPPTIDEITQLIERASLVYSPLISGSFIGKKVLITINGVDVEPVSPINWSAPVGAEPRLYSFQHTFHNFLRTGKDITLNFEFICGLTRTLPGKGDDRERGWGIDVYGNGRLVEPLLKQPFGWGTAGMSTNVPANQFIRGQLFIIGHSFAIPWDTHKREYLLDHLVSDWLRSRLRSIIKSYITIAGRFSNNTDLRKTVLATSIPKKKFETIALADGSPPNADQLPKWTYDKEDEDEAQNDDDDDTEAENDEDAEGGRDDESDAEYEDEGVESRTLSITLLPTEYDELLQRFQVDSTDDLSSVVHDCLVGGVAFTLAPEEVKASLRVFKSETLGELSEKVKAQLQKNLKGR